MQTSNHPLPLREIPSDWDIVLLDSLTSLVTSGSRGWSKHMKSDGAFFVRSQNIGRGALRWDDVAYVHPPNDQEAERARIRFNDILISVTGEPGNVALATESVIDGFVSQHVALVRLKDESLAPWAAVALSSAVGQSQFQSKTYGQTRPGLNLDSIGELLIPMPPETERTVIRQILNAVDEAIEHTRAVIDQTRKLKSALLQDLLTNGLPGRHKKFQTVDGLGTFPSTWSRVRLGEVVPYWQYGISEALADSGTMPCFRMNNLRDSKIVAADLKYAMSPAENLTRYILQVGDLLFNRTNSRDLVGRVGIFELAGDFIFASYLVQMRVDAERVNSSFLNLLLNTNKVQAQIRLLATPGVSQSNINVENMKRFTVPLPKREEQDAIVRLIAAVDFREVAETHKAKHLRQAKSALSQALLTGRIRVPSKGGK